MPPPRPSPRFHTHHTRTPLLQQGQDPSTHTQAWGSRVSTSQPPQKPAVRRRGTAKRGRERPASSARACWGASTAPCAGRARSAPQPRPQSRYRRICPAPRYRSLLTHAVPDNQGDGGSRETQAQPQQQHHRRPERRHLD